MAEEDGRGVRVADEDGIRILTLDNPPVNALGAAVRAGLAAAIAAAGADPAVRAVVIAAAGPGLAGGEDIGEFARPPVPPPLGEVLDAVEAFPRPVVAALHGDARGGGVELALSAHYRVALAACRLSLPEVTFGLLPGAGGTQRLARLVGAAAALAMLRSGQPLTAAAAEAIGLVDLVAADPAAGGEGAGEAAAARRAAVAFARGLLAEGLGPRPGRDRREGLADPAAFTAALRAARAAPPPAHLPAAARLVDCVEAALLLPFEAGLAFERAAFDDLLATEAAQGLCHAFLAERRAAHGAGRGVAVARPVEVVGVAGSGPEAADIAAAALSAGLGVVLVGQDGEAVDRGLARLAEAKERAVEAGRMTRAGLAAEWQRLIGTAEPAALAGVDLAIEAAGGDGPAAAGVLRDLGAVLRPGALVATASAAADLDRLAAATGRPADCFGLNRFAAAGGEGVVEVVAGRATAGETVATGLALCRRMRLPAVQAAAGAGPIGERILRAWQRAAELAIADGASPYAVDAAARAFGFALGPCELADRAGLDRFGGPESFAAILCARGRTGRAAGLGWYRHAADGRAGEDPEVLALVAAERAARGILPRPVGAAEIEARMLAAMVNEGARILAEGGALRPSDIDVVMVHGAGYPRWRGGPMHGADRAGLLAIRRNLLTWAAAEPEFWAPAPLIIELVKTGRGFAALDAG